MKTLLSPFSGLLREERERGHDPRRSTSSRTLSQGETPRNTATTGQNTQPCCPALSFSSRSVLQLPLHLFVFSEPKRLRHRSPKGDPADYLPSREGKREDISAGAPFRNDELTDSQEREPHPFHCLCGAHSATTRDRERRHRGRNYPPLDSAKHPLGVFPTRRRRWNRERSTHVLQERRNWAPIRWFREESGPNHIG